LGLIWYHKNMSKKESWVTQSEFRETVARLDGKLSNNSIEILNIKDDIKQIKENMMTKADGDRILSRFDAVTEYGK
jgi:hypothetical protein